MKSRTYNAEHQWSQAVTGTEKMHCKKELGTVSVCQVISDWVVRMIGEAHREVDTIQS